MDLFIVFGRDIRDLLFCLMKFHVSFVRKKMRRSEMQVGAHKWPMSSKQACGPAIAEEVTTDVQHILPLLSLLSSINSFAQQKSQLG
jgi:ribosomal protein L32